MSVNVNQPKTIATRKLMKRIGEMLSYLLKGNQVVRPSKFWSRQMKADIEDLSKYGYENFKRVIARHYFAYVPWWFMNSQVLFLITHLNPVTTLVCLWKSLVLPTHHCFNRVDSASFNFITYLLWFYTKKVDRDNILDNFEEPVIGNPPIIKHQDKLISQDVANSVLEYKSIFDTLMLVKTKLRLLLNLEQALAEMLMFF